MPKAWIFKTEPKEFSISDFCIQKEVFWEGVRNHLAKKYMKDEMQKGDFAWIYHSSCETPGVYGWAFVGAELIPDPLALDSKSDYFDPKSTQEKPIWFARKLIYRGKLEKPLTLVQMRQNQELKNLKILQKGNRLSITPVDDVDQKRLLNSMNLVLNQEFQVAEESRLIRNLKLS